jgi:uncharacterized phage-associated protein
VSIANWFILKTFACDQKEQEKINLSPMKLQKLVFFAHGWHLGWEKRPLISEDFQAWPYGPVAPSLYKAARGIGEGKIVSFLIDPLTLSSTTTSLPYDLHEDSENDLETVWNEYKYIEAVKLSGMTHAKGSPWRIIYDYYKEIGEPIPRDCVIPRESIQKYYEDLAAEMED